MSVRVETAPVVAAISGVVVVDQAGDVLRFKTGPYDTTLCATVELRPMLERCDDTVHLSRDDARALGQTLVAWADQA